MLHTHTHTHTHTQTEYVILISFPLQQFLQERASVLHYTYIARFVILKFIYDVYISSVY